MRRTPRRLVGPMTGKINDDCYGKTLPQQATCGHWVCAAAADCHGGARLGRIFRHLDRGTGSRPDQPSAGRKCCGSNALDAVPVLRATITNAGEGTTSGATVIDELPTEVTVSAGITPTIEYGNYFLLNGNLEFESQTEPCTYTATEVICTVPQEVQVRQAARSGSTYRWISPRPRAASGRT